MPVPRITFTAQEKQAYDELESYCQELMQQIAHHADTDNRTMVGFMLSFLRLRFASSLFAIREILRHRRERVEATLNHLLGDEETTQIDFESWLIAEGDEDDEDVLATVLKHCTPDDLAWEQRRLSEMLVTLEDLSGPASKCRFYLRLCKSVVSMALDEYGRPSSLHGSSTP